MGVLADGRADQHAHVGHECREQVVGDGLLHGHAGLQQHSEVPCGQSRAVTVCQRGHQAGVPSTANDVTESLDREELYGGGLS